ncbi:MAG: hypothetical protein ACFFCI_12745 [Promethearchaeota archaeon]
MKVLKEAYKNYLDGKYSFEKIKSNTDFEEAYNNKKIFVIKKHIKKDAVVIGQEGFYYIRKGEEYYYPWLEIKNIAWLRMTHGRKIRIVVNVLFWDDTFFRFIPGKYDQNEFPVGLITIGRKGIKIYETLFRNYWIPDFTFKESFPRG